MLSCFIDSMSRYFIFYLKKFTSTVNILLLNFISLVFLLDYGNCSAGFQFMDRPTL